MTGRVRNVSTHRRTPVAARWSLCSTPTETVSTPAHLAATSSLDWLAIEGPDTVAGALRRIGRWSLDLPPQRLDAVDWWFRAVFDARSSAEAVGRRLMFGGLAGECTVWLNGASLLTADNMHIAHMCDLPVLADGPNELLMRFPSLDARLSRRRPRPRWRAPMIEHQQIRWARVSLLGRTPGWSPPAPAIGPWRDIQWIDRAGIDVSELALRAERVGDVGRVTLRTVLHPLEPAGVIERATLRVSRGDVVREADLTRAGGTASSFAASLTIPDVTPWWPHTHGEPALYDAMLDVRLDGIADPVRVDLGRLGFRALTLDTSGGGFALAVNGVAVFCRGANWTPLDVVSPAASAEATRAALAQVRAAGLNMLRVNGCMVYEDAAFYEACDELGLLVWQDFMFANMDYPADADFLASVREEAGQQLALWQAHPSLTLICGNSEAEQQAAMWGSPRDAWSQPLFDDHLAALAGAICPGVPYWPSSAHGGAFPHQNDVGTTSYYGVGAYLRPMEDARRSGVRFASECLALANVPPPSTIARMPGGGSLRCHHPGWKARTPRDLGAGSDFEDVRDHYLRRLYGVDPVALRAVDHERYLQLSRAVSAEVMQATMSEWRRPASACRGALVWLLRDVWAGAGWGLLDDNGTPKAAFHGLRRASAPIHIFMTDEGTNGVALHVVNDPGVDLAATVEVGLYREDGRLMQSQTRPIMVPAHDAVSRAVGEWFDQFVDLSRAYRFGPAEYAVMVATLRDFAGGTLDRAFFLPGGLTAAQRHDVALAVSGAEALADGGVVVTLATRMFAQSVHFDADGYVAEDEFFHMAPGESRTIRLNRSVATAESAAHIRVMATNATAGATVGIAR